MAENENEGRDFLIFSIKDRLLAVETRLIKEIARDVKVNPLPFVPRYVEGVINCQGVPHVVVNPCVLFDSEENIVLEDGNFLVFRREDDRMSLHISTIGQKCTLTEDDFAQGAGKLSFSFDGREITVLNPDVIESRLRKDLVL